MIPSVAGRPAPPAPIALSKVLLVEGATPRNFCEALLRELGISNEIEVRDFGGVDDFGKFIRTFSATPGFDLVSSIGVMRDAENDANAARQSIKDALKRNGIEPPSVDTSVFIFPDNRRAGMIETLCVDSVRQEPVFQCVEKFFECARNAGALMPTDVREAKALAQAYLATRPEVQLYPGVAAYHNYWPWSSAAFDDLKQFLQAI